MRWSIAAIVVLAAPWAVAESTACGPATDKERQAVQQLTEMRETINAAIKMIDDQIADLERMITEGAHDPSYLTLLDDTYILRDDLTAQQTEVDAIVANVCARVTP